jgi:3-dehydrosphinganine reductase
MMFFVAAGILVVGGLLYMAFQYTSEEIPTYNLYGKNVVITGGSSGIGKAIAKSLARLGCDITIIATNQDGIDTALTEIKQARKSDSVYVNGAKADVTDRVALCSVIQDAAARHQGVIDVLITCAGISRPGRFLEVQDADFEKSMQVNYLGTVYAVRAAVPFMKNGGRIMLASSMGGLSGISGLSTYCPTKFAIRGLAECLQMELRHRRIYTSCLTPPDVDTPMYREEMKTKPAETMLISKGSGLAKPETIAADCVSTLQEYEFFCTSGFDGNMQSILTIGMAPSSSIRQIALEFFSIGFLRLVSLFYLKKFNDICLNVHKDRVKQGLDKSYSIPYNVASKPAPELPSSPKFSTSFTSFSAFSDHKTS